MFPTSTPRSPGRRAVRARVAAPSRCVRSGRRSRRRRTMGEGSARDAAETIARRSYGKLVALLSARTRDVAGAEDALSEAFAIALVEWRAAIPENPEAWLMT